MATIEGDRGGVLDWRASHTRTGSVTQGPELELPLRLAVTELGESNPGSQRLQAWSNVRAEWRSEQQWSKYRQA